MSRRILLFVILILGSTCAYAFDGHRKGFVLGGGVGIAPIAHYERTQVNIENTSTSLVFDLVVGLGFSDRDLIVLDYRVAPHGVDDVQDLYVANGFLGLCWQHYFSSKHKSAFSSIGLGRVVLVTMDVRRNRPYNKLYNDHWSSAGSGWGVTLGLGYQFARRIQISGNYCAGGFALEDSSRLRQSTVDITVALMLF